MYFGVVPWKASKLIQLYQLKNCTFSIQVCKVSFSETTGIWTQHAPERKVTAWHRNLRLNRIYSTVSSNAPVLWDAVEYHPHGAGKYSRWSTEDIHVVWEQLETTHDILQVQNAMRCPHVRSWIKPLVFANQRQKDTLTTPDTTVVSQDPLTTLEFYCFLLAEKRPSTWGIRAMQKQELVHRYWAWH